MQGQSQTSQIAIGAMDEANSARSSISCTMPSYTGQDSGSKFNISTTQQACPPQTLGTLSYLLADSNEKVRLL